VTDLAFRMPGRPLTAPAVWSGRILSGVIGGFLAVEGLARLLAGRALVAPSEAAPVLEAPLQTGLGAALLLGVALLAAGRTRLAGAILLTLDLGGLLAAEVQAASPSLSHILFWAYVGLLIWSGFALRRLRVRP
jgi:hypothetical protein